MNETINNQACATFQAQLPELIGSGENVTNHAHLKDCADCRALMADLQAIADAARQLFPVEEPPDALWQQIESAIEKEDHINAKRG